MICLYEGNSQGFCCNRCLVLHPLIQSHNLQSQYVLCNESSIRFILSHQLHIFHDPPFFVFLAETAMTPTLILKASPFFSSPWWAKLPICNGKNFQFKRMIVCTKKKLWSFSLQDKCHLTTIQNKIKRKNALKSTATQKKFIVTFCYANKLSLCYFVESE